MTLLSSGCCQQQWGFPRLTGTTDIFELPYFMDLEVKAKEAGGTWLRSFDEPGEGLHSNTAVLMQTPGLFFLEIQCVSEMKSKLTLKRKWFGFSHMLFYSLHSAQKGAVPPGNFPNSQQALIEHPLFTYRYTKPGLSI